MVKIKVWFKEGIYEDETNDKELLLDCIDILAADKTFIKCEITYADGNVKTLVNGDYAA